MKVFLFVIEGLIIKYNKTGTEKEAKNKMKH